MALACGLAVGTRRADGRRPTEARAFAAAAPAGAEHWRRPVAVGVRPGVRASQVV